MKSFCLYCGKEIDSKTVRKYCNNKCQSNKQQLDWEEKWFRGEVSGNNNSNYCQIRDRVRTYLFRVNDNKCSICGWGEMNPFTNKIPLEVDHIDGDPYNTVPDNLRLICPNCHSLTKNYRGANRGNGRKQTVVPT